MTGSNVKRSSHYGALQRVVDSLFEEDDAPYLEVADPEAAFKVSRLQASPKTSCEWWGSCLRETTRACA